MGKLPMDFFAAQEHARRRTRRLVAIFGLAVLGTIAACYVAAAWALGARVGPSLKGWWDLQLFAQVAGAVVLVVAGAAWFKWQQYAAGGAAVAQQAGGRRVSPDTLRADERRLLNVVEEMAIASGLPVPAVFVLDGEPGINAFAAGLTPSDAAVAVTQGALAQLSRDELQGVIGHEFSHILNGDMRLNLRLGALVFGILVLGLTGRAVLWSLRGARLRGKNNGGVILLVVAAGVALLVIGYVGYFFGRLAQAAISRQREFLADASAVQFTRNPEGLASALRRIAGATGGSRLVSIKTEALGHFLFAQGFRSWLGGLWATHPDIRERIRAIDPTSGGLMQVRPKNQVATATDGPTSLISATACLGTLSGPQVDRASALVAIIPAPLRTAARDVAIAPALLAGLMLSSDESTRLRQWQRLGTYREQLDGMADSLHALRPALRLPLAQLALATLRGERAESRTQLQRVLADLARTDGQVSLFEFTLMAMTRRELAGGNSVRNQSSASTPAQASHDEAVVLSALAMAGATEAEEGAKAYTRGVAQVYPPDFGEKFIAMTDFARLDEALDRLATCSPMSRQRVLQAGAAIIDADGMRTIDEVELLRAVAAALGCPMSLPA